MSASIFDKILSEIVLDPRIRDGMFNVEEEKHMDILREYLINKGINESSVIEFTNRVLEGKYPERQAYNAKGILVTFPTPEYKKEAIRRGTHFEQNPVKGKSNLFQSPPPDKATPEEKPSPQDKPTEQPKTQLPVSQ